MSAFVNDPEAGLDARRGRRPRRGHRAHVRDVVVLLHDPVGSCSTHHRERSFFWGYGHMAIFGSIAATGAGLHAVQYALEEHSLLSTYRHDRSPSSSPSRCSRRCSTCMYAVSMRAADPFHLMLLGRHRRLPARALGPRRLGRVAWPPAWWSSPSPPLVDGRRLRDHRPPPRPGARRAPEGHLQRPLARPQRSRSGSSAARHDAPRRSRGDAMIRFVARSPRSPPTDDQITDWLFLGVLGLVFGAPLLWLRGRCTAGGAHRRRAARLAVRRGQLVVLDQPPRGRPPSGGGPARPRTHPTDARGRDRRAARRRAVGSISGRPCRRCGDHGRCWRHHPCLAPRRWPGWPRCSRPSPRTGVAPVHAGQRRLDGCR